MKRTQLKWIFIATLLIILAFSLPFLLDWEHFRLSTDIDANRFSQYGEYIGGLLGATFAGMGFFILALSYSHQMAAARSSEQQQGMQQINSLYESVVLEINSIRYREWTGHEVFFQVTVHTLGEDQNVLDQLNSAINSMQHLITTAKNTEYPSEDFRRLTLSRVYMLSYSRIIWPANARIMSDNLPIKERLRQGHDDFPHYFKRYEQLKDETFEYLGKENLIGRKTPSTSTSTTQTTIRPE